MKKICHISGTTVPGGGPEHLYQLLKRMDIRKWEPLVCTKMDGVYWNKFESLGIRLYDLVLREISLVSLIQLYSILRREKPDLIHTHGKGPGLYGRIIGRLLNIPIVHTFHGFHYEDLSRYTRQFHLLIDSLLALVTDKHIFVSTGEKNRARVVKFLDEENSTIIPNGVDYEPIQNLIIDRKRVLQSIDCEGWEQCKILGTISRLSPEKGIHNLLVGFSRALQSAPDLRLIVVGGYPEEHKKYYLETKNLIEKEHLAEYVRILGYRNDALKILKCMDFYISSSLSEGLPISLLEASAAKVPTIATEIIGNKEVIRNSVFGVLAEPESPQGLAEGILKMLALPPRVRELMIRNSFNLIKNKFSVDAMANSTFLIYNEVLNKAGR